MTDSKDSVSRERFKVMERKLYRGIMTPAMLATLLFGIWMLLKNPVYLQQLWIQIKLLLVALLVGYHLWCGAVLKKFANDQPTHSHIYFRWMNEVPVLFLITIICLAVFRPI
jgi:putative membrane protein